MQHFHQNHNSSELIVFFAGWGCDYNQFTNLHDNKDVLILYDYQDLKLDFDFGAIGACKLSLAVSFAVFIHYFGSAAVRHFLLVQTIARATTFIITC